MSNELEEMNELVRNQEGNDQLDTVPLSGPCKFCRGANNSPLMKTCPACNTEQCAGCYGDSDICSICEYGDS